MSAPKPSREAMEFVREAVSAICANCEGGPCGSCQPKRDRIAAAIDSALQSARDEAYERAAEECERLWKESPNDSPHYRQNAISDGCIESAAAIRALKGGAK